MLKKVVNAIICGGKRVKWTHFKPVEGGIKPSEVAYSEVKEMNKQIKRLSKKFPDAGPVKAAALPLQCGMAQVVLWYGTYNY